MRTVGYPADAGVTLTKLSHGSPGRNWQSFLARRTDGVCWAGFSLHEGERRWDDAEAVCDVTTILFQLNATAAAGLYNSRAGTN